MKIVCISDTHVKHRFTPYAEGDILIFAGDAEFRIAMDVIQFNSWLTTTKFKTKIVIAGNHDFYAEKNPDKTKKLLFDAVYLQNESYILPNGMKVWGSPMTPMFYDWAFMYDPKDAHKYWDLIPTDTDILVTHGPAYGHLDVAEKRYGHLGCKELSKAIERIKPKYHIFGHIHEGGTCGWRDGKVHGIEEFNGTTFINCSLLDDSYCHAYEPIVIEV